MTANWAGNVVYSASRREAPTSLAELRSVVASSAQVHAVGAGHSFSRIADTTGTLLSLDRMPHLFSAGSTVRVGAGMRLAQLALLLDAEGLALHTMPSLPHITIAGAVATATHGSGDTCASLASAVRSLDLVSAKGDVVTVSGDDLHGAVVSLGGLGVVTALELAVVPAFEVEQRVWEGVPWQTLVDHLDAVFASAYSVSAFVDWRGSATLWVKRRTSDEPADLSWTGAREASGPRHPVPGQSAVHCTEQLGTPGPWHERLPHFRAEFTPSVGAELQSEYFVPRTRAAAALSALAAISPVFAPLVQACELRTVAAEPHWLSPAHDTASLAVHFTWTADTAAVRAVLPQIEAALTPRPHWAKLSEIPPTTLSERYPNWSAFKSLLTTHDPTAKFRNAPLTHYFQPT